MQYLIEDRPWHNRRMIIKNNSYVIPAFVVIPDKTGRKFQITAGRESGKAKSRTLFPVTVVWLF